MNRKFSKRAFNLLKEKVEGIADWIDGDNKAIVESVAKTINPFVGRELIPCQTSDYVLLDNPVGVATICQLAQSRKELTLSVAFVQPWRSTFDPESPSYIGDYQLCQDRATVEFLNKMRGILKSHRTFCEDPLASSLVLGVEGWSKVSKTQFSKFIENITMRSYASAWDSIPSDLLRVNANVGYILRALRAIALRYNEGATKTGCYKPIAIPAYVNKL
jgi:hypothetical protein